MISTRQSLLRVVIIYSMCFLRLDLFVLCSSCNCLRLQSVSLTINLAKRRFFLLYRNITPRTIHTTATKRTVSSSRMYGITKAIVATVATTGTSKCKSQSPKSKLEKPLSVLGARPSTGQSFRSGSESVLSLGPRFACSDPHPGQHLSAKVSASYQYWHSLHIDLVTTVSARLGC